MSREGIKTVLRAMLCESSRSYLKEVLLALSINGLHESIGQ